MELTIIRHTDVDVGAGICYGQQDVPLAPSFQDELEIIQKQLADESYDAVYSSPLSRCTKLAEACGFDPKLDNNLMEMHFGDWELKKWDEIEQDPFSKEWMDDYLNLPVPGGESFGEVKERIQAFLDEIRQTEAQKILVFAHSGPIRLFYHLINQVSPEDLFKLTIDFGSIHKLTIDD